MLWKQPKTSAVQKVKVQLLTVPESDDSRNFVWVARTLIIRNDQVALKPGFQGHALSHRGKSGK